MHPLQNIGDFHDVHGLEDAVEPALAGHDSGLLERLHQGHRFTQGQPHHRVVMTNRRSASVEACRQSCLRLYPEPRGGPPGPAFAQPVQIEWANSTANTTNARALARSSQGNKRRRPISVAPTMNRGKRVTA